MDDSGNEEMSDLQKINKLADSVAGLGDAMQHGLGTDAVIHCAVVALVHTHPDPKAFAQAFRQYWQRFGSPNKWPDDDAAFPQGIASLLTELESACSVPLNVRPPDVATKPGQ